MDHISGMLWEDHQGLVFYNDDEEDDQAPQHQPFGDQGAGGSGDVYRDMSRGDWQAYQGAWMGQMDTWRTRTDERFDWMYDHMVRQIQHLSTRDHLEPPIQINTFPGREQDYPPFGYYGHFPPGYDYRYGAPPSDFFYVMM